MLTPEREQEIREWNDGLSYHSTAYPAVRDLLAEIDRLRAEGTTLSACHDAPLDASLSDGRLTGSCSVCGATLIHRP